MKIEPQFTSSPAPKPPAAKSSLWKNALEYAVYPLAVGLGIFSFRNEVEKSIYKNVIEVDGTLKAMQASNKDALARAITQSAANGESVGRTMYKVNKQHSNDVKAFFQSQLKMSGMVDYLEGLKTHQIISASVIGATVASIVIGAVLLIKENDKVQQLFAEKRERDEAAARKV